MASVRTARLISDGPALGPQAFTRAFAAFHAQYAKETSDFEELSLAPPLPYCCPYPCPYCTLTPSLSYSSWVRRENGKRGGAVRAPAPPSLPPPVT